jgi:hypothetical protein
MTRELIITTDMKKEIGYLYFVTFDEDNNLLVWKTEAKRGGKKKVKIDKPLTELLIKSDGRGRPKGFKVSEEIRKKMSERMMGNKNWKGKDGTKQT